MEMRGKFAKWNRNEAVVGARNEPVCKRETIGMKYVTARKQLRRVVNSAARPAWVDPLSKREGVDAKDLSEELRNEAVAGARNEPVGGRESLEMTQVTTEKQLRRTVNSTPCPASGHTRSQGEGMIAEGFTMNRRLEADRGAPNEAVYGEQNINMKQVAPLNEPKEMGETAIDEKCVKRSTQAWWSRWYIPRLQLRLKPLKDDGRSFNLPAAKFFKVPDSESQVVGSTRDLLACTFSGTKTRKRKAEQNEGLRLVCVGGVWRDRGVLRVLGLAEVGKKRGVGRARDGVVGLVRDGLDESGYPERGESLCRVWGDLYRRVDSLALAGREIAPGFLGFARHDDLRRRLIGDSARAERGALKNPREDRNGPRAEEEERRVVGFKNSGRLSADQRGLARRRSVGADASGADGRTSGRRRGGSRRIGGRILGGIVEFGDGAKLDLADPFASHAQPAADFLQGQRRIAFKAVAQGNDHPFASVEAIEASTKVAALVKSFKRGVGSVAKIGKIVGRPAVRVVVGGGRFAADLTGGQGAFDQDDLGFGEIETRGDLIAGRLAAEFAAELTLDAPPFLQKGDHVSRKADRRGGVGERGANRLFDPIARIGAESRAEPRVIFGRGADEAEIAFADQVVKGKAAPGVVASDADDESQVGLNQPTFGVSVAAGDRLGEGSFLEGGQQGVVANLVEIDIQGRVRGASRELHGDHGVRLLNPRSPLEFSAEAPRTVQKGMSTRNRLLRPELPSVPWKAPTAAGFIAPPLDRPRCRDSRLPNETQRGSSPSWRDRVESSSPRTFSNRHLPSWNSDEKPALFFGEIAIFFQIDQKRSNPHKTDVPAAGSSMREEREKFAKIGGMGAFSVVGAVDPAIIRTAFGGFGPCPQESGREVATMDDVVFVELLERAKQGDEVAAKTLLERFENDVRAVVRIKLPKTLRTRFDSMDFVQAVWQSFFSDLTHDSARFENSKHLRRFLAGVAKNKVVEEHRKQTMTRKYNLAREEGLYVRRGRGEEPRDLPASDPSPSQNLQAEDCLKGIVSGVKPDEAEIVELRRDGFTFEQIADKIGMSESVVRRILDHLRKRWELRGGRGPIAKSEENECR